MNAADVLKWGDHFYRSSLTDIPPSAMTTTGVCGVWSVKDVAAHLSASECVLAGALATLVGEANSPALQDRFSHGDAWNDWAVDQRRHLSFDEVMAEYDDAFHRSMALIARIPPEDIRRAGILSWYGDAYDLDDYLVYSVYGHKREHGAEIRHFRSALHAG